MPSKTNPEGYSYCEPVVAGSRTRWHIRELTKAGRKPGSGGADMDALCGYHVKRGWDLPYPITIDKMEHTCQTCFEAYAKLVLTVCDKCHKPIPEDVPFLGTCPQCLLKDFGVKAANHVATFGEDAMALAQFIVNSKRSVAYTGTNWAVRLALEGATFELYHGNPGEPLPVCININVGDAQETLLLGPDIIPIVLQKFSQLRLPV